MNSSISHFKVATLAGALAFLLVAPSVFAQTGYQRVQRADMQAQQVERQEAAEAKKGEMEAMQAERQDAMEAKKTEVEAQKAERMEAMETKKADHAAAAEEREAMMAGKKEEMEAKREERAAAMEERKAELETKRIEREATIEEKRAEIETRKAERVAALSEQRQERVTQVAANATDRLEAGITKVQGAIDSISERAQSLEDQGVAVDTAFATLASAESTLEEAAILVSGLSVEVEYATTSDDPQADWEGARAQFDAIRNLIKEAAELTRQAVAELKAAAGASRDTVESEATTQ